ncbi:ATP-binding protein [Chryseosolibacter indicus]|uniref:histidine kinase n=1 Tax=Chryseosolibacter indicus TaxID=2782351 RepID=A0ABS5VXM2_9BACT|nr:ATP-binding protein [Chryseosolibacter indicus]MBT1706158.1 PAS domain S-box protein [Chryseosolibacter indicus]
MKEIVKVKLENEMDLILAHKRAMKLCELTGFSLINQTSIATAVSEIARCAIEHGQNAILLLGIESGVTKKFLKASIRDTIDFTQRAGEACSYAKRLVDDIEIVRSGKDIQINLKQQLNFGGTITDSKIESFIGYFKNEPPLSAYDELRRKNLLLQDLAEKIRDSENDYRILTDSLPLMMFSVNNRGVITYTNKWLQDFLGTVPKELNSNAWQNFLHPSDYSAFGKEITASVQRQSPFNGQYRFKEKATGNFIWHMFSAIPLKNEKEIVTRWIGFIVDISAQKQVDQTLKDNKELKEIQDQLFNNQEELQRKVVELNRSNYELEQFAHLASHDLQEPLRKLFFYSDVLKRKFSDKIDEAGVGILNNMTAAAGRMKELINDLLSYSQLQKQQIVFEDVDLNDTISDIIKDLDLTIKEKNAVVKFAEMPNVRGNPLRLRQLFINLISNSLKYSKKDVAPQIEITSETDGGNYYIRVKDNGIGFEEQYSERIFGLFERLHTRNEFPGTGIGLSICKRIAELHQGKISATSKVGEYSIFSIELPVVGKKETVEAD